jgi:hypothetical protein
MSPRLVHNDKRELARYNLAQGAMATHEHQHPSRTGNQAARARARAEGLSVEAYLERLLRAEQSAEDELTTLALDGVHAGDPIEVGPGYWEAKHQEFDERLRGADGQ